MNRQHSELRPERDVLVPRFGRLRDWIIGGLLLATLLVAVQWTVGWRSLLAPWRDLSPWLLAWLLLLTASSYALRAVRVSDYFSPRFAGRFLLMLRLTILHNTANNLLPMRTGELVFPWLMRRYFGQGLLESAAALLWLRLFDLHCLVLIALLIAHLSQPSLLWWLLALLWIAGLGLIPVIGGLSQMAILNGDGRLRSVICRVLVSAPRHPRLILRIYIWTVLIWGLKFAAFTSLLSDFLHSDVWRLLAGVMGAELSTVLPFHGIAGAGSYELAAVAALVPLGVDPRLALAGAVNLHLFLLGATLILGALALRLPKPAQPASP